MNDLRRVDRTLRVLDDAWRGLDADDRQKLAGEPLFAAIRVLSEARSMELAEQDVRPGMEQIADLYDEIAVPGEPAVEALLRVFEAILARDVAGPTP